MDINKWTKERGYERPMGALAGMAESQREAIRSTLDFSWPKGSAGNPELEAKAILNHDLWGIVGRLHYKTESLNRWKPNLSWSGVLRRILDVHFKKPVPADLGERELERAFIEQYVGFRGELKPKPDTIPLPPVGPSKRTTAVLVLLKAAEAVADRLLGSTDPPAIHAAFAICLELHEDLANEVGGAV